MYENLSHMAVEGLDTILLTLIDIATDFDEMDMEMLKNMTQGEGQGLANIRQNYLDDKHELDSGSKALLLSSTNHIESLRKTFGSIGQNYSKLAEVS